jgi:uncharacterized protein (TIGR02996 family)
VIGRLRAARKAIAEAEPEQAMEELVSAWREHRSDAIAELVVALDARMPPVRVAGVPVSAAYEERWERKARKASVALVGGFANMIDRASRLDAVLVHAPDPRISRVVAAILEDLRPALRGDEELTRELWLRCAEAVETLDDPALVSLREAEAPWNSDWNVGGLTIRLDLSLTQIERRFPDGAPSLDEEAAALVTDMRERLREPRLDRARSEEAELLARIYAAPDDDGLRAVYADWLLERGDERGELIHLQLREDLDARAEERRRALEEEAAKRWVGPLAPVVSRAEFRRGLLSAAEVDWRHRGNVRRLGAHPAWATVERVTFPSRWGRGQYAPQHLDASVTKSLCAVNGVTESGVEVLCQASEPWTLSELSVTVDTPTSKQLMAETELLPRLSAFWLVNDVSFGALAWLFRAAYRTQLRSLRVSVRGRRDLWRLQREASRLHGLERLVVQLGVVVLELTRGPEHRLSDAVLAVVNDYRAQQEAALEVVETAPDYAFTRLEIHASLDDAQLVRLDDAAARQRGLDDLVVVGESPSERP